MITEAAILAARRGLKLGKKTEDRSKGFLKLNRESIIEQSVCKLLNRGIQKIIIDTGYCSEWNDQLAEKYNSLICIKNGQYAQTGSMGTLEVCADSISGNFLLLESDIIYDEIDLTILCNNKRDNIILASGKTDSGDKVYIKVDEKIQLINLSKNKNQLDSVYAEFTGITKLTKKVLNAMCTFAAVHHGI